MKKTLVALVLLLFLASGAGAAWWILLREGLTGAAEEGAAGEPDRAYVDMGQMVVPVIRADGSVRTFILELSLEVTGEQSAAVVRELMPRLRDSFLVTLNELLGRRFMEERDYDQDLIRHHLLRVARHTIGEERVESVLIRALEQRGRG